jgi:hypothetical protein
MKAEYNEPTVDLFMQLIKPFKSVSVNNFEAGTQVDVAMEPGEGNSLYRLITYYAGLVH